MSVRDILLNMKSEKSREEEERATPTESAPSDAGSPMRNLLTRMKSGSVQTAGESETAGAAAVSSVNKGTTTVDREERSRLLNEAWNRQQEALVSRDSGFGSHEDYEAATAALNALMRDAEREDYIEKYQGKTFDDNFWGQAKASYTQGRIGQDSSLAWNEYLNNPTEENRAYAEALDQLLDEFQLNNQETLKDDAKAPILSQSLAGYLPQLGDQLKHQVVGGATGALAGSVIAPGAGTLTGAKIGAVAATGKYSYETMRGAAFRGLLELGMDEERAMAAANDEAVVSSLIEMADTGVDIATLGIGKLIGSVAKGGVKAVAGEAAEAAGKKLLKGLAKYVLNVAGEMVEEGAQQAVSLANQQRTGSGVGNLAGSAVGVSLGALLGNDEQSKANAAAILEDAKEGGKIAALIGGATSAVTGITNAALNRKTAKAGEISRQEQPEAEKRPQIPTPALSQDTSEGVYTSEEKQTAEAREMALEQMLNQDGTTLEQPAGFTPEVQPSDTVDEIARKTAQLRSDIQTGAQKTLGKEGYRAFEADFRNAPESDPVETYRQLTRAYNEGVANRRSTDSTLSAARYNAMFEAGRKDAKASLQAQAQQAGQAVVHKGGIDYADTATSEYMKTSVDQKTAKVVDRAAKALGVQVRFADTVAGGSANAQIENGVVTIEKGNPHPVRFLFGHEITHRMQELAPAEYNRLREAVTAGGWADAGIKDIQSRYAEHGKSIDSDAALNEAVADYVGTLLEDSGELERFIARSQGDRTLLQKLRDAFRDLKERLRGSEHYKQLKQVEQRLTEALQASEKQVQSSVQAEKNTAQDGGEGKLSIRSGFYETLDKWDRKTTGFSFVVGETSEALQSAGIPKKQIRMDATKIVSLLNKHSGMTMDIVRKIPELLENPVVVIDSKKGNHAKIVMGDLVDTNNKTVTAVLLLTPTSKKGNVLDIIKISSAEGRDHIRSLFFKEDKSPVAVRYVDKKRIQSWLNANRLQLPLHNLGLDPDTTVAQQDEIVKGEPVGSAKLSLKDSEGRTLSEGQREYFKDSKARDDKGQLMVLYHGTDTSDHFSQFKTYHEERFDEGDSSGYSVWQRYGAYTSTNKQAAGVFAAWGTLKMNLIPTATKETHDAIGQHIAEKGSSQARIYQMYANLVKPLIVDAHGSMWDEIDISEYEEINGDMAWAEGEVKTDDLAEYAWNSGYDGLIIKNVREADGKYLGDDVIVFDPSQLKYTDNLNPTKDPDIRHSLKNSASLAREIARIQKEGAASKRSDADIQADIRAVVDEAYQGFIGEYGAIEPGEKPARDIQVPQKTAKDKKVSQTVRTVLEAGATPDEAVPTIEQMVATGDFSYDTYTDKEAITDADGRIRKVGWAQSLSDWMAAVKKGEVSKANTATGWALYNNAANSGDTETAMTILSAMVQHQRSAAQALQATRILKNLSPETQLYQVQRSVERLQEELNERYGKKGEENRQATEAVGGARKEAAKKIRDAGNGVSVKRRGNRVVVEGNQAGEPFAFEYAQKVGEALAKSLAVKKSPQEKTFLQEITAQLKRFAKEKMESTPARRQLTATELLRDYIQNQDFYNEAWEAAQIELRREHGDDPALTEFINSGIGVDSTINPRNAIFMKALVKAAAESSENRQMLTRQSALGFTEMAETIAQKLIEDTGATGEMAETLRDAASAYVNDVLRESDADQTKVVEASIKSAIKDIGTTLSKVVAAGSAAKRSAKQEITQKLIAKYGFGMAQATYVADVVGEHFDRMSRDLARKQLEARFKDRPRTQKSLSQILEEYGNLGAFDAGSLYNEAATGKIFKMDAPLRVNEELARQFLAAANQEERDEILKDIYRDIGRQLPSTFKDKWNAWRYLAMLGNARTHVRNVLGNAGFAPVVAAKNLTATAIEAAVDRLSGGRLNRTKAFVGVSKADRALLKAAWDDYAKVQDTALSGGKYSDFANANQYIEEGRRIFKNKALEAARRGNTKAMEQEDAWFSRPHYAAAMASWCKQNGVTPEQIASGKAIKPARAYAIKEAQKATYRDTNALSQTIGELGRVRSGETNAVKKGVGLVMEGILPFRKTPANILARGLEYSPAGLANGIKQALFDVRKGKKTGAEAIDSISAGLTGTGLLALGVYMASQGLIRGHGDDDEKKNEYEELMGHQAYSLELPDGTSVTLDWLAPECLPFFVGVNLWEQTDGGEDNLTLSTMLSSVATVTEPLLEMSCLQSLNDVFDAVGYAASDGLDGLPAALASAATSYLTQGLPTILGQAERTGEDARMTTYTEKNAFLTSDMQYTLGRASARLPGWEYQQIPYIDAWGRTEKNSSTGERAFNNFLNPAYTSKIEASDMEEELLRLYDEVGESGILPSRAAKYFNVNGARKDLTAEEYVAYATNKGQTAYSLLTELTAGSAYKTMSDAEKAEAVSKCYEYANAVAKAAVSDYEPEGWVAKAISTGKTTGIKAEKYVTLYLQQKGMESLKDANGETISNSLGLQIMEMVWNTSGLTDQQRQALFEDFGVGKTIRHYNKALVEQKLAEMKKKAG